MPCWSYAFGFNICDNRGTLFTTAIVDRAIKNKLIFSLLIPNPGYYFSAGLALIGITGFLDDIIDLSAKIRFPFQVISILLIIAEVNLLGSDIWILLLIVILATGILNAYNFMDGINGITGGYSIITVVTLMFVNNYVYQFTDNSFLVIIIWFP